MRLGAVEQRRTAKSFLRCCMVGFQVDRRVWSQIHRRSSHGESLRGNKTMPHFSLPNSVRVPSSDPNFNKVGAPGSQISTSNQTCQKPRASISSCAPFDPTIQYLESPLPLSRATISGSVVHRFFPSESSSETTRKVAKMTGRKRRHSQASEEAILSSSKRSRATGITQPAKNARIESKFAIPSARIYLPLEELSLILLPGRVPRAF